MAFFDFHMHSSYSNDGDLTPQELIEMAVRSGITILSLTDHNTTAGVAEMVQAGEAAGIRVIPGIEINCFYKNIILHVLGYNIDPQNKKILEIEQDIMEKYKAASDEIIRLINKTGIDVENEEVYSKSRYRIATGELIAEVVLQKPGAENNPLLVPYLPGGNRDDNPYANFYWDFCGQGKPAYVYVEYPSLDYTIAVINEAGGVPVLGHPGQLLRGIEEMLPSICSRGINVSARQPFHKSSMSNFCFKPKAVSSKILESP